MNLHRAAKRLGCVEHLRNGKFVVYIYVYIYNSSSVGLIDKSNAYYRIHNLESLEKRGEEEEKPR